MRTETATDIDRRRGADAPRHPPQGGVADPALASSVPSLPADAYVDPAPGADASTTPSPAGPAVAPSPAGAGGPATDADARDRSAADAVEQVAAGNGGLDRHSPPADAAPRSWIATAMHLTRALGPYVIASVLLLLGYLHYAPGTAYSFSAERYRDWAFPAFRYSDIIWLYLRDGLQARPIPYVDFPLEYPPLTGLLTYVIALAPDLPSFFAVAYGLLAACALGTIWALSRIPDVNAWWFALAPALFFYSGHQWDIAAVFATAVALLLYARGHDRWGMVGLAVAVSLKLFPVAFVAAVLAERVRQRRWREAIVQGALFAAGTVAVNLPVALLNVDGWSFFFRWNRDRLADSGLWVLLRGAPTADLTTYSLLAAGLGGLLLAGLALWRGGPLLLPLGATALLWWLAVNKTFTTHLILWVFLALALLRAPRWLWGATVAVDLVGFQLGNYLNLYNVNEYHYAPLIRKAVENIYDPLQVARSVVLLAAVGWGVFVIWRRCGIVLPTATTMPRSPHFPLPMRPRGASSPGLGSRDMSRAPGRCRRWRWRGGPAADPASGPDPSPRSLPSPWGRRLLWGGGAALLFAAATVALTWPYALHLGDSTVVGFDPFLQIWLAGWIRHALTTDPLTLFQANIFYPFDLTLAYTDPNVPGALIAAAVDAVANDPILTNSLLTLGSFVLAAGGAYALVVHLSGNRAAGLLAGLAYAFLPYRLIHLWHLNWLQGAWLPWTLLALLRVVERPTWRRGLVFGLLVAVMTLTSFYFLLQIGLLALAVVGAALRRRRVAPVRRLLGALGVAAIVAAVLCVPLLLPHLQVRNEQGLQRTLAEAERYKAEPASYVTVAPWDEPIPPWSWFGVRPGPNAALTEVGQATHADGHRHAEIVIEDALFPGGLTLVGAAVALAWWRRSRWLVAALAAVAAGAAVLSLGPTLGPEEGDGLPLPYGWFFEHVPFFAAMRVPARLGGLVAFCLVVLAGLGAAAAWARLRPRLPAGKARRWLGVVATAALAALVLLESAALPIPLESVDRSEAVAAPYEWLAAQPPGPTMEFPAESIFADPAGSSVRRHVGLSMFWSMRHWNPIVNGNSGFIPRAHSDFIDRFMGVLPRPDGTLTGRVSHVNVETAPLLRQLGVRYLLFHRSQYRPEDWPAVVAQLASAEAWYEPVGDVGEAAIYRLRQPTPPAPAPTLALYAPTLLGPESPWGPWLAARTPGEAPAVLSLTRPAVLSVTWYDDAGRHLRTSGARLPLPVVADVSQLLCDAERCAPADDADFPTDLPDPEPQWRPTKPGHYVARLALGGDRPLACRVDLDVVETASEVEDRSPDNPLRWAECTETGSVPVNNPGAAPFRAPPPSVTFVGGDLAVEANLVTRRDEEVRAWFFLAEPGTATPWARPAYRSPVQQQVVPAREPTAFDWLVRPGDEVPPGVYGLSIWFHHRTDDGWQHAYGEGFDLAPVVVRPDGSLRWAGPIRLTRPPRPPHLVAGQPATLRLDVAGETEDIRCAARWRLLDSAGTPSASGHAGRCDRPRIDLPASVVPGSYRLEVTALTMREEDDARGRRADVSDALSLPVVVVEPERPGTPR